ncbi:MAG: alpha/beta hydrolase [Ferruginibacter sp.]
MLKYFFVSVLVIGIYSSCSKENVSADSVAASTQLNIAYAADPLQNMDIYLPANRSAFTTKVLVMIHGGAWSSGDKADFNAYVDTMKRRLSTYAVFNINYRLATGTSNIFPTQENDVKAAIEFIYSKRNEYLISDKYILLGASAGAHLALLQSYKYSSPVKPKAVVDFFGPTDMVDMYNNPASVFVSPALIASLMGGTPTSNPIIYSQSSPINFVSAVSAMPTIMLHGGTDPLVRASQSVALQTKLNTAGVINQYVYYPLGGHGDWDNATYFDAFNKVQAFITVNVQ